MNWAQQIQADENLAILKKIYIPNLRASEINYNIDISQFNQFAVIFMYNKYSFQLQFGKSDLYQPKITLTPQYQFLLKTGEQDKQIDDSLVQDLITNKKQILFTNTPKQRPLIYFEDGVVYLTLVVSDDNQVINGLKKTVKIQEQDYVFQIDFVHYTERSQLGCLCDNGESHLANLHSDTYSDLIHKYIQFQDEHIACQGISLLSVAQLFGLSIFTVIRDFEVIRKQKQSINYFNMNKQLDLKLRKIPHLNLEQGFVDSINIEDSYLENSVGSVQLNRSDLSYSESNPLQSSNQSDRI